jgi:hypothetical protein
VDLDRHELARLAADLAAQGVYVGTSSWKGEALLRLIQARLPMVGTLGTLPGKVSTHTPVYRRGHISRRPRPSG